MTASLNLSSIRTSLKAQSAVGSLATGAGATQLDILSSQGFSQQMATVLSELLDTTRMAGKPRQGSRFFNWAVDTEATVGAQEVPLAAVMGGTFASTIAVTESTLTSVVISGTGTVLTFAAGSLITAGARVGMMATFTLLATSANDNVPFPITSMSSDGRTIGIPSGYLVDETIDSAFTITLARTLITATPYTDSVFTVEHYLQGLASPRALIGQDVRFNSFMVTVGPDKKVKFSFGAGAVDLTLLANGSSPTFSSPTLVQGESLYLSDGGVYVGGVKRVNLSGLTIKMEAPVSGVPLIGTNVSPDAFLGQFKGTGQMTGTLQDGTDFDAYKAETAAQIILHMKEQNTQNYISLAITNAAYGGWSMPAGGEGPAIQTVPLYFGKDKRGATLGYAPSMLVICST